MGNLVEDSHNLGELSSGVLNHNLEWSEELPCEQLSLFQSSEMLNWHFDCSWLIRSVLGGDRMASQRNATEKEFSSFKGKHFIDMGFNLIIVPT